jgi:DNA-directed RNA polymerase subunit omega
MPINKPGIGELSKKVDCRYTLCIAVAKRARQLVSGALPLIDPKDMKPVSIAVEEINRDLISYHRNFEDEE